MSTKKVAGAAATAPATIASGRAGLSPKQSGGLPGETHSPRECGCGADQKSGCQPSIPMPILTPVPADVKMLEEFQQRNIPNIDIIDTMRTAWPGFDKSLLSKCRNYKHYGVGLRKEAVKLLSEHFHMEAPEAKRKPLRKKPHRIQCRLTDAMYDQLQRRLAQTGQNAQDYLEAIILADLQAHAKELRT